MLVYMRPIGLRRWDFVGFECLVRCGDAVIGGRKKDSEQNFKWQLSKLSSHWGAKVPFRRPVRKRLLGRLKVMSCCK